MVGEGSSAQDFQSALNFGGEQLYFRSKISRRCLSCLSNELKKRHDSGSKSGRDARIIIIYFLKKTMPALPSADQSDSATDSASYRSGIAARLAGVPVETLRVWERRYGVIGPRLSARGQRLYSALEIKRLALVKNLVDVGHSIGSIAALPTDVLMAMRANASALAPPQSAPSPVVKRVALVGRLLAACRFEDALAQGTLQIVGRCDDVAPAAAQLAAVRADVVVIELSLLNEVSFDAVTSVKQACGAAHAVVLYRFAPSVLIRRLRDAGHEVVRAPWDGGVIEALCLALLRLPAAALPAVPALLAEALPPPPRFSERALLDLSSIASSVYCECPHHLAQLLLSLNSFERYSAECAQRDLEDAALHLDLQRSAGQARTILEDALFRLAQSEGLALPPAA